MHGCPQVKKNNGRIIFLTLKRSLREGGVWGGGCNPQLHSKLNYDSINIFSVLVSSCDCNYFVDLKPFPVKTRTF